MGLSYFVNDELPQWVATVSVNGATHDYSTGWTFTVTLNQGSSAAVLTKTTNITGSTGGVITVAWAVGDLNLDPGLYRALLVAKRTADNLEHTVKEMVEVTARA